MHILLFHPVQLPPKDYGGVERVVLWLAQGLLERGHQVSIAALKGSILPKGCNLVEFNKGPFTADTLKKVFPKDLDVAHFMAPIPDAIWSELEIPRVLTVHGNGKEGERFPQNTVFLSKDHALRHGGKIFIYNGIQPDEYLFEPHKKEDWILFLSKTSWRVKNLAGAMHACSKAGVKLKIAGGNRPYLARLKSFLTPSFEWMGPVHSQKKAELLAHANAFIFPVLWPEPFGLVVAESLMSGTPVFASPKGSLPELIPQDVGALLQTEEDWIQALKKGGKGWISERCRQWALEKFHYSGMAEGYERVYRRVIRGEFLHQDAPIGKGWKLG